MGKFIASTSRIAFFGLILGMGIASAQFTDPPPWTGSTPTSPANFRRDTLVSGLNLPMQFQEAQDGRIFILQQTGELVMHDPVTRITKKLTKLALFHLNEHGGLGLALDPAFSTNGWLYICYTPTKFLAKVSRFTFSAGSVDTSTEKILLQYPVVEASHMAGALEFGPDGNLFISTGADNQGSGAPNAWLTSGNTFDLRGKMLRIKPTSSGGYTVPTGNLYPIGTAKTQPQIYSLGHRNPFRFSVDPRTGYLYVAEVGDAWEELNQIRTPGNYGYPNYEGNTAGAMVNSYPGNTGLADLPATRPTWITYGAGDFTKSFPKIDALNRNGGSSIMAGPVYYFNNQAPTHRGLPSFYHGHLFWYDHNKGMIFNTRLGSQGEPAATTEAFAGLGFLPTVPAMGGGLNGDSIIVAGGARTGLIDMKMGRYGNPLILEYASGKLFSINYTGTYPVGLAKAVNPVKVMRMKGGKTVFRIPSSADFNASIPAIRILDMRGSEVARLIPYLVGNTWEAEWHTNPGLAKGIYQMHASSGTRAFHSLLMEGN